MIHSRKKIVWSVGLIIWTFFCLLTGALAYKKNLHTSVFQILGIGNEIQGPLKFEGSILEFDKELLSSVKPIHRFVATNEKEWKIWKQSLTNDLENLLSLDEMPKGFVPIPKVVERTTTLIRGSSAADHTEITPPKETPAAPILPWSTSFI